MSKDREWDWMFTQTTYQQVHCTPWNEVGTYMCVGGQSEAKVLHRSSCSAYASGGGGGEGGDEAKVKDKKGKGEVLGGGRTRKTTR